MAETGQKTEPKQHQQLEGGAYEVIRARLEKGAAELRDRLGALNSERQSVFGAIEPELVATERVTTANNCIPRDLISVGNGVFFFGYNVQLGLKSTTDPKDVFSAYRYDRETHVFHELLLEEVIEDSGFADDFAYLYKYYKETIFVKFMVRGAHLFMAFRVGKGVDDIKTFKFLREGDGKLSYIGNRAFTFKAATTHRKDMPRFLAAYGIGLFFSMGCIYVLTFWIHPAIGQLITTVLAAVVIYTSLLLLKFGQQDPQNAN